MPQKSPLQYRCETTSLEGFIQQIACCYLRHGYWWYVTGAFPPDKDRRAIDVKLITKYGIAVSESTRLRRKRVGLANLQYLRWQDRFTILATKGEHPFFQIEAKAIRDIRRVPLRIGGYSISYRRSGKHRNFGQETTWHSHVQIELSRYRELQARFLHHATRYSSEKLALAFYEIPFEPYAPVLRQMFNLWRMVNAKRKQAGLPLIPSEALPMRRRIVKPFKHSDDGMFCSERSLHSTKKP